jgi:hypothetical protein
MKMIMVNLKKIIHDDKNRSSKDLLNMLKITFHNRRLVFLRDDIINIA